MAELDRLNYYVSLQDFRQARRRAALQQVLSRLTGRSNELLAYEDVRKKLRATNTLARGLHDIPVDAIVGSVGRYQDFTRTFLPKQHSNQERWARVKTAATTLGWQPIEVYKVGDAYFVIDGHHRVSVARQQGMTTLPARVTEVKTRVPLAASDDPEELICKARYVEFLEQTNLDKLRPEADLLMTFCGQYRVLLEHINVHRYYMGLDQQRHDIPYDEAVAHWYDTVYMPVVELIREQGLLYEFPELTEVDLYVLLAEHRAELEQALGWGVDAETVAADLAGQKSRSPVRAVARVGARLLDAVTSDDVETAPLPSQGLSERLSRRHNDRLFADILVAINGTEAGWRALTQALTVAQREGGRVLGLHIVPTEEQAQDPAIGAMRDEFMRRSSEAGVIAEFVVRVGIVTSTLVERTAWVDLLTLPLTHPPGPGPLARLGSNIATLVQRSPRPVLSVPVGAMSSLDQALLAYDGSPKSNEALFVASYLAAHWQIGLVVLTVAGNGGGETASASARQYLQEHNVPAEFVVRQAPVAEAILETAAAYNSNLLIMGGFSFRPVLQVVLGSTVEQMLREFSQPILICR
ncbi:MAG TPA: universal stress protein [Anaerolineae bacterium]